MGAFDAGDELKTKSPEDIDSTPGDSSTSGFSSNLGVSNSVTARAALNRAGEAQPRQKLFPLGRPRKENPAWAGVGLRGSGAVRRQQGVCRQLHFHAASQAASHPLRPPRFHQPGRGRAHSQTDGRAATACSQQHLSDKI